MAKDLEILGVRIDNLNLAGAVKRVEKFISSPGSDLVVTPNAEMIVKAYKDQELRAILNQAQLAVPDGAGVVLAARLLGFSLEERVTGIDLVTKLLTRGNQAGYRFYFLGAAPGVAEKAKIKVQQDYPGLTIKTHHGYLDRTLEEQVVADIKQSKIDVLLVGMGVPLQEKWLAKHLANLPVGVGMGVGGTFDILAGTKSRAPNIMQNLNLEWLYRLGQEPERIVRMKALPEFIYKVIQQKLKIK